MARVDTPFGPVRGAERTIDGTTVLHFGGVPYARAERFGLPERVEWIDELDATRPGPAAPQTIGGLDLVPGMAPEHQSEDCLLAEIFTTGIHGDGRGNAPVLVWVPGGSYRIGGAGLDTYDGSALACTGGGAGAVVIGLNYRLGVLGWLCADGVPTNLALRDLRAALEWIQEVAPSFGGDPSRVTVMGESAGSGMLAHLLASSANAGAPPMHGAILQSGAPAGTLDAEAAEWVTGQFLADAGVTSVDELRTLPIDALLVAQEATVAAALPKVGMMPFHPWIDGDLLTGRAHTAEFPAIPLVVGTTAHEMELFRDQVPQLPEEHALGFLALKGLTLGITDADAASAAFAAAGGDLVESVADLELHVPNELLARAHEARGNTVYRYRFTWEAPVKRACHALDLPFTFGTLDVDTWREFAGATGTDAPAADALSDRMRAAWVRFAATGAPWDTRDRMQLGRDDTTGPDAVSERVDLWIGDE